MTKHIETKIEKYSWKALLQMKKMKNWNIDKVIGTKIDYNEGTDFIVNGLRVDVSSMSKDVDKNGLHKLTVLLNDSGEEVVWAYLRTTNKKLKKQKKNFKIPVLCIIFENNFEDDISDFFFYEYSRIEELFWDKVDELGLDF